MKISARLRAILFLLCLGFPLFPKDYVFDKLSLEDGLSSDAVYRIVQDSTGYMWFGTFSGLNRYDGRKIRTYKPEPGRTRSLSSPVIFELFEDSKKRLWVGTDGGGLNLYNRSTDDFTLYRHDDSIGSSLSSNNVYAICEDHEGRLWVGTGGGGLNLFNEENGTFSVSRASSAKDTLDSDVIRDLFVDEQDNLWIGTAGGGLSLRLKDGTFRTFRADKSDKHSLSSDEVRAIFEDTEGTLWIGTEGGGLNRFDRKSERFDHIRIPAGDTETEYSVRAISEDRDGNLWIGTEGRGIYILDKKGNLIASIRHKSSVSTSLSKDKIRDIFIDVNGLMWIATRDGGVNRYNGSNRGFKTREYADIRAVYEDSEGNIWAGSDGEGLDLFDSRGTLVSHYHQSSGGKPGLSSNQVYAILEDKRGEFWIGTDGGGLNRLNRENNTFRSYKSDPENPRSINSNTVWSLLEDSYGTLWVGTEGGGLNAMDREMGTFKAYTSNPEDRTSLNGNSVRVIYEDSERNLWIGTWDGGLNLFNREKGTFHRYSREPDKASSLSDSSVNTIFEDSKGRLWIGTAAGGLDLMDRKTGTFTHYRTQDGMSGDNILGILEDDEGHLWISTDRGLTKFNPDTGETLNFGKVDGLSGSSFSINACVRLESGEMVFGGHDGVTRFFPESINVNRTIPPVVITDISVMNKPISFNPEKKSQLVLNHDDNILNITFAVLDFTAPEKNRYAVILDGLQDQWTDLGNQNSIIYNSLPPGKYTFRVKGADNNGIWNNNGVSMDIQVLPPWWETPLFYIVSTLVLGFSIFALVRMRLSRLEEKNRELREYSIHIQDVREEERTWVAREVHDELGQNLTALKMEIFRGGAEQRDSMLDLVNMSLDSVKDLSTRLRPKVLDNLCIGEAVAWLVRDFSSHSGIKVIEDLDEKLSIGDVEVKTAIFRICQEVLTNVIRHSGADRINVSLSADSREVMLKIADNGCGIGEEALEKTRSFGIRGIKERCRYLGGTYRISGAEREGTEVTVCIPLQAKKKEL